jgi:hypothetical protein
MVTMMIVAWFNPRVLEFGAGKKEIFYEFRRAVPAGSVEGGPGARFVRAAQ